MVFADKRLGVDLKEKLALAKKLFAEGSYQFSTTMAEDIVRLNPSNYEALNLLALIKQASGDLGAAESLFRRAIEANPESPMAKINLATILNEGRRFDEALVLCESAVSSQIGRAHV